MKKFFLLQLSRTSTALFAVFAVVMISCQHPNYYGRGAVANTQYAPASSLQREIKIPESVDIISGLSQDLGVRRENSLMVMGSSDLPQDVYYTDYVNAFREKFRTLTRKYNARALFEAIVDPSTNTFGVIGMMHTLGGENELSLLNELKQSFYQITREYSVASSFRTEMPRRVQVAQPQQMQPRKQMRIRF